MKRIFRNSILAVAALLLAQGCSKDYLDTIPSDSVGPSTVFATTKNAWGAINGIHRLLYMQWAQQDQAGEQSMCINSDYLGEDIVMTAAGSGWYNTHHQWRGHVTSTNATVYFAWRMYYRVIANCNMILENIDNATGAASEKDHIKGQALAYRGWAHYQLVQIYGKRYNWTAKPNTQLGVPIMIKSTTEPQARATVEEVYTQINKDLDDAIALLNGKPTRAKSHISVAVARGIKARVALTTGNWQTAYEMAALARAGLSLMSQAQLLEGFNKITNPEYIWGCEVVSDQTTFFFSFYAYMSFNFSSTMNRSNPKRCNVLLYNQIPATDVRRQWWEATSAAARTRLTAAGIPTTFTATTHHNFKFRAVDQADSRGDFPYMRVAEMYLIEAEAYARFGNNTLAQDRLFTLISSRDPGYVKSTLTGTALIDHILLHRRIELWGEGFRFYDMKRLDIALNRNGANHTASLAFTFDVPAGDNRWQWMIPEDEMKANPKMVQNP